MSHKRKLSCTLMDQKLPEQIVKYCVDPYFYSRPFDSVVGHLQIIFAQKPQESHFVFRCQLFRDASSDYRSIVHCILCRIQLVNTGWVNLKPMLVANVKRLRHNAYNQL